MKRLSTVFLVLILLITLVLSLSGCKTETEKAIESYDKSIKVAEQQRREAEKKLRDIENYKYSQYILENMKP
ncbi:MAG: hypothetical protein IJV40_16320 [Oscillospiraceae bacterium]|nr:hypothetical protein [Oscillospiraceae bacterium]